MRTEPCACGGVIVQESPHAKIQDLVAQHVGSLLHMEWRFRYRPLPAGPTSATAVRDLSDRTRAASGWPEEGAA